MTIRTTRQQAPDRPDMFLAVFGKHPGWNDHIDDIGIETEPLVVVKRALYLDAVRGNIDSGVWDRLDDGARLDGFRHCFAWRTHGAWTVGRMWASRDGKGRAKYPMVVCASSSSYPLHWLLETAMPRLKEAEEQFRATESADGVRRAAADARQALRRSAMEQNEPPPEVPDSFASPRALSVMAEQLKSTGNSDAFARFYYKVARDLAAHREPPGAKDEPPMPQHLRLPAGEDDCTRSLIAWTVMMSNLLYAGVPLLLFRATGESWVDIIVGEPRTPQLFCLLAKPEALPAATDVPYSLEPSTVELSNRKIDEWSTEEAGLDPACLRCDEPEARAGGGLKQILGGMRNLFGR